MNQADCVIKVGNTFLAQEYISSVTVKVSIKKVEIFYPKIYLKILELLLNCTFF